MLKHADVNAIVYNMVDLIISNYCICCIYSVAANVLFVLEFTGGGIITSPYIELYFVSSLRTRLTTKFYSQAFR